MIWQLVKFKIKTFIGWKALLVFLAVYLEFILLLSLFYWNSPSATRELSSRLATSMIYFFSFLFFGHIFNAPLLFEKSDADFLMSLPIDEKDIGITYSLSLLLVDLYISVFAVIILFPAFSHFSVLIVLLTSIMNAFSFFVFKGKRKIIAYVITVWMLFSITKFPFTPLSMLSGYIYGYFILAGLDVMIVLLGIRNVSIEDLINEFYKRQKLLKPRGKKAT